MEIPEDISVYPHNSDYQFPPEGTTVGRRGLMTLWLRAMSASRGIQYKSNYAGYGPWYECPVCKAEMRIKYEKGEEKPGVVVSSDPCTCPLIKRNAELMGEPPLKQQDDTKQFKVLGQIMAEISHEYNARCIMVWRNHVVPGQAKNAQKFGFTFATADGRLFEAQIRKYAPDGTSHSRWQKEQRKRRKLEASQMQIQEANATEEDATAHPEGGETKKRKREAFTYGVDYIEEVNLIVDHHREKLEALKKQLQKQYRESGLTQGGANSGMAEPPEPTASAQNQQLPAPESTTTEQNQQQPAPESTTTEQSQQQPAPESTTTEQSQQQPAPESTTTEQNQQQPAPESTTTEQSQQQPAPESTASEHNNEEPAMRCFCCDEAAMIVLDCPNCVEKPRLCGQCYEKLLCVRKDDPLASPQLKDSFLKVNNEEGIACPHCRAAVGRYITEGDGSSLPASSVYGWIGRRPEQSLFAYGKSSAIFEVLIKPYVDALHEVAQDKKKLAHLKQQDIPHPHTKASWGRQLAKWEENILLEENHYRGHIMGTEWVWGGETNFSKVTSDKIPVDVLEKAQRVTEGKEAIDVLEGCTEAQKIKNDDRQLLRAIYSDASSEPGLISDSPDH